MNDYIRIQQKKIAHFLNFSFLLTVFHAYLRHIYL